MWDKLSMSDRARLIQLAVQNGISDLDTIRSSYNEYAKGGAVNKFAGGGSEEGGSYWGDLAYAIMAAPKYRNNNNSVTTGVDRGISDIFTGLFKKSDIIDQRSSIPRNLASLYIYGNDLGQFERADYLKGRGTDFSRQIAAGGRNANDIVTYRGDIPLPEDFYIFPELSRQPIIDAINDNSTSMGTYGANTNDWADNDYQGDDVAKFDQKVELDQHGNPIIVSSDYWDFSPKYTLDYGDADSSNGSLMTELERSMLDKVGNPFILKDVTPIQFADDNEFFDKWEEDWNNLPAVVRGSMSDAGILQPIVVYGDTEEDAVSPQQKKSPGEPTTYREKINKRENDRVKSKAFGGRINRFDTGGGYLTGEVPQIERAGQQSNGRPASTGFYSSKDYLPKGSDQYWPTSYDFNSYVNTLGMHSPQYAGFYDTKGTEGKMQEMLDRGVKENSEILNSPEYQQRVSNTLSPNDPISGNLMAQEFSRRQINNMKNTGLTPFEWVDSVSGASMSGATAYQTNITPEYDSLTGVMVPKMQSSIAVNPGLYDDSTLFNVYNNSEYERGLQDTVNHELWHATIGERPGDRLQAANALRNNINEYATNLEEELHARNDHSFDDVDIMDLMSEETRQKYKDFYFNNPDTSVYDIVFSNNAMYPFEGYYDDYVVTPSEEALQNLDAEDIEYFLKEPEEVRNTAMALHRLSMQTGRSYEDLLNDPNLLDLVGYDSYSSYNPSQSDLARLIYMNKKSLLEYMNKFI